MPNELLGRVRTRSLNSAMVHDFATWFRGKVRIHPPAQPEQIERTEAQLGFKQPELLKRILSEVGNGGSGPGYGLIGVDGGHADFKGEHLAELGREPGALERKILPICNWGCGIYCCLECSNADSSVSNFNPKTHALAEENLISVTATSAFGETNRIFERRAKPARPSIITPTQLSLIRHKDSFTQFTSEWADGVLLWDQIESSL